LFAKHSLTPLSQTQLSSAQASLWLDQGNLNAAARWAEQVNIKQIDPIHQSEALAFAKVQMALGNYEKARPVLDNVLQVARSQNLITVVILCQSLLALAHQSHGESVKAQECLNEALSLAEPEGFIRAFVDEGPSMARLLYKALSREIAPAYVRRLLAAFPSPKLEETTQAQTSEFDWVEPLSERELEVLQLIAEGLTNKEVSDRLYLSPNTVKVHNRTIFSKLGVKSRTQAVARARGMGLLKSNG